MSVFDEINEAGHAAAHGIEAAGREVADGVSRAAAFLGAAPGGQAGGRGAPPGYDPASITEHDNWNSWNHQRIYTMLHDIDPERIRDQADRWAAVGEEIRQVFDSLEHQLRSTIRDGWSGAAAESAAQAPAALAEWGRQLAASAESTGHSMREAATGAERAQRSVHPPKELNWRAELSGVLDHLIKEDGSEHASASDAADASRSYAAAQAADEQARRTATQVFSPSYVTADSAVPAFAPPADPTGGASGAGGTSGGSGADSVAAPAAASAAGRASPSASPPVRVARGEGQFDSPTFETAPRSASSRAHAQQPVQAVSAESGYDQPISSSAASVGSEPGFGYSQPVSSYSDAGGSGGGWSLGGGSTQRDLDSRGGWSGSGVPGGSVAGDLPGGAAPDPARGSVLPGGGLAGGGAPGGGVPGTAGPGGGLPGGRLPAPAPQPAPIGGAGPTGQAGAGPVGSAASGSGSGVLAGVPFAGGRGGRRDKRRKAYGAGLFEDPFTGEREPTDGAHPHDREPVDGEPNATVNQGIPAETAAEQTGPIYLDEIRGGFGPQGANSVAPPVIGQA